MSTTLDENEGDPKQEHYAQVVSLSPKDCREVAEKFSTFLATTDEPTMGDVVKAVGGENQLLAVARQIQAWAEFLNEQADTLVALANELGWEVVGMRRFDNAGDAALDALSESLAAGRTYIEPPNTKRDDE